MVLCENLSNLYKLYVLHIGVYEKIIFNARAMFFLMLFWS